MIGHSNYTLAHCRFMAQDTLNFNEIVQHPRSRSCATKNAHFSPFTGTLLSSTKPRTLIQYVMPQHLTRQTIPGAPDDVTLFVSTDVDPATKDNKVAESARTAGELAVLDATERARADAFRFSRDRDRFVHAHALKRQAISHMMPEVRAASWHFGLPEPGGKPFAIAPNGERGPKFSLTHCEGLVAVAVSGWREVGLDAEPTHRPELSLDLARSSFAPVEVRNLNAIPHPGATLARLWCGKEALSKAIGFGLALDFKTLVIDPHNSTIERAAPPMHADDWSFLYPEAPAGFTLALAWRHR
jgi:4'-phosphopantetheinyl transferase